MSKKANVAGLCRRAQMSSQNYYALRKERQRQEVDADLVVRLVRQERRTQSRIGGRKLIKLIGQELREHGVEIGRDRFFDVLRSRDLLVEPKPAALPKTTNSRHPLRVFTNLVAGFTPTAPNQAWASDITYIRADHGWMYLCVFIDLFSRRVVGWAVENHMQASLVTKAWENALHYRRIFTDLIVHSDRGIQYCCKETRDAFAESRNVTQSMSRKGNCWDNACAESFFSTLKRELEIDKTILTESELRRTLFQYLEGYYNTSRMHSYLGYQTPSEFEKSFASSSVHENG